MKKFLFVLLMVASLAHAQKVADATKAEARARSIIDAAAAQDAVRLSRLPKSLVQGKILSVSADGYLVSCDAATISHPAMPSIAVYTLPSQDRLIWIAREPAAIVLNCGEGSAVSLLAKEDGTHTYTTVLQRQNTVANFRAPEMTPPYCVITKLDRNGKPEQGAPVVARGSAQTPELTLKRSW